MIDARIFTDSLDWARGILEEKGFLFKGKYVIHDKIYSSKDPTQDLAKVFMRLRLIPENIWDEKPFIVSIKNTELMGVGKQSVIPLKEQFDTEDEARAFIANSYADTFDFAFEFDRMGWQYDLGDQQVDLEDIEGHCSINLKSPTEAGLRALLDQIGVRPEEVIKGPSVVAMRDLLTTR